MQQRKREAYMELLSRLISSKYEAAKQRLAAVTIQVRRVVVVQAVGAGTVDKKCKRRPSTQHGA